jgi:hypothetical protein
MADRRDRGGEGEWADSGKSIGDNVEHAVDGFSAALRWLLELV